MGTCPKCGARIKRKNKAQGVRICRRHGPIERVFPTISEDQIQHQMTGLYDAKLANQQAEIRRLSMRDLLRNARGGISLPPLSVLNVSEKHPDLSR